MAHLVGTVSNFDQEVTQYKGKVLVDFWASWCGPCQMLAPIIDEINQELKGQVKIVKVDVDSEPSLADKFNINGIPAVIIFDNGKVVDNIVGFHQKPEYLAALNK